MLFLFPVRSRWSYLLGPRFYQHGGTLQLLPWQGLFGAALSAPPGRTPWAPSLNLEFCCGLTLREGRQLWLSTAQVTFSLSEHSITGIGAESHLLGGRWGHGASVTRTLCSPSWYSIFRVSSRPRSQTAQLRSDVRLRMFSFSLWAVFLKLYCFTFLV